MKKHSLLTVLSIAAFLQLEAQKENYFSLESGVYVGKANANIASSMAQSGLGDYSKGNSNWIALLTGFGISGGQYPFDWVDKIKYRIRAGHYINSQTALEAGFGLTYYGIVKGYDKTLGDLYSNYLGIKSRINTFYVAFIRNNSAHSAGFGAGPAFSLYKLSTISAVSERSKNHLLPGGMITSFWNFLSKRSWFVGLRTELSLTIPIKIDEIKITNTSNPLFVSTFKSTKTGSLNGSITLNAGIRF